MVIVSFIGNSTQAPTFMFGPSRRSTRNFLAALLCGCWVALTLLVPVIQSQHVVLKTTVVDCVSASLPSTTPFSDTSIDESTLRLSQSVSKIDDVERYSVPSRLLKQWTVSTSSPSHGGSSLFNPSLLTLGIALRL